MEKQGAFYLFSLRLIPLFPFWAINLVMGLTHYSRDYILLGQSAGDAGRNRSIC